MEIRLKQALLEEKNKLSNLLEKYNYEFSQYDKIPYDENGLFGYHYLDNYWTDEDRFPYFILVDNKLAGFALINKHPECHKPVDWAVAEFFVTYHYRKQGVATAIMNEIFHIHKGCWHIKYHKDNIASSVFWNKIAKKYSNDNYEICRGSEDYHDGTEATVLCFQVL